MKIMNLARHNTRAAVSTMLFISAILSSSLSYAKEQRVLIKLKNSNVFRSIVQIDVASSGKSAMSAADVAQLRSMKLQMVFPNTNVKFENGLNSTRSMVAKINSADLESLRANPNVEYVDVEVFHPAPKPVLGMIYSPVATGAPAFTPTASTPWGILAVKAIEAWSVAGKGGNSRVMVLDTGIDKGHPSIKNNFEEGRNFTGEDSINSQDFSDSVGHGTHVSGTIAGTIDSTGFSGVAPEAKLLMGKVCDDKGCSNIAIAQGINWAIQKKVDVVSMSLGGPWSTPSERDAIAKAHEAGITLVAATGNDGTNRVSYPAALSEVIAVGATDITGQRASFSQFGPEVAIVAPGVDVVSSVPMGSGRASKVQMNINGDASMTEVRSTAFQGSHSINQAVENQLVYAGLGRVEDFKNIDVTGKFALIQRGEIRFSEKALNAIKAKAAGVIIYNNAPGSVRGALTEDGSELSIPVFGIEQKVGEIAKDAIERGMTIRGRVSIETTDYAAFDGTSMATPHVSGVVALMKSANKALTPAQVKAIIQKTATKVDSNPDNQYGAGIINAEAAVKEAKTTAELVTPIGETGKETPRFDLAM